MAKKRKLEEVNIVEELTGEYVRPVEEPAEAVEEVTSAGAVSLVRKQEELKTRRVQLVLKPSLYQKAQRIAKKNKISVNEYISILLEADIAKREA